MFVKRWEDYARREDDVEVFVLWSRDGKAGQTDEARQAPKQA